MEFVESRKPQIRQRVDQIPKNTLLSGSEEYLVLRLCQCSDHVLGVVSYFVRHAREHADDNPIVWLDALERRSKRLFHSALWHRNGKPALWR